VDRQTLVELFDYTTFTWASYGNAVRTLPPEALTRQIDDSGWGDLRTALFHVAAGWDSWLRDRARANDPLAERPDDMATWVDLEAVRHRTRAWLQHVIDITPDANLYERTTAVLDPARESMPASVADVLAHILLHERGHHGDITTLLARLGATPAGVDYLVYRWFAQRAGR